MPTTVQFRRGTTTQNNSFTGAVGELTVDTTLDTLVVHDGSTAGGHTLLSDTGTQTVSNKTIDSDSNTITLDLSEGTLTGSTAEFNTALSDDSFCTLTNSVTLTNKTLTSPVISSISNTGTLTLPTSSDTLVGRGTTDTLTNKTLTSPTINTPTITGDTTFSDGAYDFDIASHDGTNGLKLGGTLVTATAAELNYCDGVTSNIQTQIDNISSSFTLAADSGTNDTFTTGSTLTFTGDTGITTTVSDDTITIDLDDTAVTAGSYGSSTAIPTFTVDATGRITAASTTSISSDMSIAGDSGTDTITVGTDTFTISGGTGVTTTASTDEISIAIGQAVSTTSDVTFNDVTVSGDLTVNGATTTVSSTNMVVEDNLIELNNGATSNANDSGIVIERGSTGDNAFMGWDESADKFVLGTTTATGASTGDLTITTGTVVANVEGNVTGDLTGDVTGDVTGNADTATTLANSRTISLSGDVSGSASFDGSGDATISCSIQANSVALGTDTTGNYMAQVSAGAGIDVTHTQGEGSTATIAVESDLRGDVTQIGQDTNDYYSIGTTAHNWFLDGAEDMRLENDGDLHLEGDVVAHSSTVSDERLKTNIETIENALEKVASLRGCTFHYTMDNTDSAGLIAQEVEKVLPSAVKNKKLSLKQNDGIEYKVLQYDQTIGLLVEAIKELKTKIEKLEG